MQSVVAQTFQEEAGRVIAILFASIRDLELVEDAVQDAFVRLQAAGDVTSPEGFLIRTTTRLCIDRPRADRRRKG